MRAHRAVLRSLAALAVACTAGCARDAADEAATMASAAAPAALEAELHGARLLRRVPEASAPVPVFDARRGPVLRLRSAPPAGARLAGHDHFRP
jgi:hypothetical protein